MIYGYARVSTVGQAREGNSLEAQEAALRQNGVVKIFSDAVTGKKKHRPGLDELLSVIGEGDTLVVTKLDRIARSTIGGIELVSSLLERGVRVNILNMGVVDNTPVSKLMRTMFFAFAEYERDMIVERTLEGKAIAKQDPDYREGRKPVEYDGEMFLQLYSEVKAKRMTVTEAAEELGVSRGKWYRIVKEHEDDTIIHNTSEHNGYFVIK